MVVFPWLCLFTRGYVASLGIEYITCGDSGHVLNGKTLTDLQGASQNPHAAVEKTHVGRTQGVPRRKQHPRCCFFVHFSGHITATSHDLTRPNGSFFGRGMGNLISGKSRLVKYYNLAR